MVYWMDLRDVQIMMYWVDLFDVLFNFDGTGCGSLVVVLSLSIREVVSWAPLVPAASSLRR
jgi:hypothetical protein